MISRKTSLNIATGLGAIIIILLLVLFFVPAPQGGDHDVPREHRALKEGLIVVEAPIIEEEIESPVVIEGEAVGPWFFEASFPVSVLDPEGNILGQAPAEAVEEWMTTDFVPFRAEVEFDATGLSSGFILLEKANASGLPEHDDELRFPVNFK